MEAADFHISQFVDRPEFPLIQNELTFKHVFIRVFNMFPHWPIKLDLAELICELRKRT